MLQIGAGRSESSPSALREATGLLREIGQPVAFAIPEFVLNDRVGFYVFTVVKTTRARV